MTVSVLGFIFVNISYKYKDFRKQGKNEDGMEFKWVQIKKNVNPNKSRNIFRQRMYERSASNPKTE
jgi:hypothetical protein